MTPPLEDVDVRAAIQRGRDDEFDKRQLCGRCKRCLALVLPAERIRSCKAIVPIERSLHCAGDGRGLTFKAVEKFNHVSPRDLTMILGYLSENRTAGFNEICGLSYAVRAKQ
jgi:hypothetical protein